MMTKEFRQILAQLELLSHGSTQSWNKTAQAADRDQRPGGEAFPPHEQFRIDWYCATSDEARVDVLEAARRYLKEWKGQKVKKPTATRSQADIDAEMRSYAGWTPREIARRTGNVITEGMVMTWRKGHTVDPSTGYEVKPIDKRSKVVQLHHGGMAQAEIAKVTGVTRQAVSQMLKRAA